MVQIPLYIIENALSGVDIGCIRERWHHGDGLVTGLSALKSVSGLDVGLLGI
jgi:hypothetical protein